MRSTQQLTRAATVVAIALICLVAPNGVSQAQRGGPPGGGPGRGRGGPPGAMLGIPPLPPELALSEEQRAKVDALVAGFRSANDQTPEARAQLRTSIEAVLTDAQRTWIAEHAPKPCVPSTATALSDEQRAQLAAAMETFRQADKSTPEAMRTARAALEKQRDAILTAEQKASGCFAGPGRGRGAGLRPPPPPAV